MGCPLFLTCPSQTLVCYLPILISEVLWFSLPKVQNLFSKPFRQWVIIHSLSFFVKFIFYGMWSSTSLLIKGSFDDGCDAESFYWAWMHLSVKRRMQFKRWDLDERKVYAWCRWENEGRKLVWGCGNKMAKDETPAQQFRKCLKGKIADWANN